MNKLRLFCIFCLLLVTALFEGSLYAQKGWCIKQPFEHDVFIENKGQFIDQVKKGVGQQILYYSHKGHIHIYFTPGGLTFEYDSAYIDKDRDALVQSADDEDARVKILPVFMHVNWKGANPGVAVEVQNPVSNYFTYRDPNDKTGHKGIQANAWRKVIYRNLYNNIDVEFYYPEDGQGLEYNIIVHPGGNLADVKMNYSSNAQVKLIDKIIHIFSPCANFTDRAPIARDEDGNAVTASFSVKGNSVAFNTGSYDKSKTLVIDPLYSTTSFTGTNKAYDLQYDLAGNVYVMGGGDKTEYQLQKYSAAGALLWTYTSTFSYTSKSSYYYGGFTTDNRSGNSFVAEGLNYSGSGCSIVKVSSATGTPIATFAGSKDINEIWRLAYDYCDNQLIIGAGEGSSAVYQGATMDTNCTAVNAVNVLGAGANDTHHDIAMITFDGVGKCYFATTKPADSKYTGYENVLLQMPSATLAPTAYQVSDRSNFIETASIPYYPALLSGVYIYSGNGFNGLIADLNLVATYDGNKLRTWTPATGAIIDSVTVTPNTQLWGGIALDCQDNIYVGNLNKVNVYSSALALVNTINLTSSKATDTVYDLHLAPNNNIYACGNDFVSATPVTIPKMVTTTSTSPTGCGCTGTASATVCDNYPYTYSWSNGATTSSISGLCPGKYLLTVKDASCNPRQDTATVTITGPAGGLTSTTANNNVSCYGLSNGSATVTASKGTAPYTYSWSNGITTTSDTGLAAGTYTCIVTDNGGCADTVKVTITQPPLLKVTAATFSVTCNGNCNGQATVVPSGGTSPYSYIWSNGASSAGVSALCAGSYTATVTDNKGCKHDTTITINQPPPIVITKSSTPALCTQSNGTASITASGGTAPYTYLWSTGGTGSSITGVSGGTYCVNVTDANNCTDSVCVIVPVIPGDSVKIVSTTNVTCNGGNNGSATASAMGGTPPYTYSWSTTPVQTTATATGLTAGSYTITVTDNNGCQNTAIAVITQPTPVTLIVPSDTICIGQSTTLTATASGGTPPYTYMWNGTIPGASYTVNPTSTTNYVVQATDANGCTSPVTTATVFVRNPLIVVAGPPTHMCPGGSVTLTATGAGGNGKYTYTWTPGPFTGPSITVSPTTTTTYTVLLTDGCTALPAIDSVKVVIDPAPVVNFVADTLQGCAPLCVKFTDLSTVASGTDTSWVWNFGDGDTSHSQNPTHCYNNPGVFTVSLTVTSSNGCTSSKTIVNYITVYAHPQADFSFSPQPTNLLNPTIYFTDHSTDPYGIVSWDWTFGDALDSVSSLQNPQHTYQDTGTYCPWLVVTNVHGCTDSIEKCLEIEPYFTIYVPNAFTPNSNGLNDVFTAKGVGILTYQMWIFDRWGQQLYYTTDINKGWNGVVQRGSSGQEAQEDTYVWLIKVTDVFHKDHRFIGRVTLIK